jgi:hypothetical protein
LATAGEDVAVPAKIDRSPKRVFRAETTVSKFDRAVVAAAEMRVSDTTVLTPTKNSAKFEDKSCTVFSAVCIAPMTKSCSRARV